MGTSFWDRFGELRLQNSVSIAALWFRSSSYALIVAGSASLVTVGYAEGAWALPLRTRSLCVGRSSLDSGHNAFAAYSMSYGSSLSLGFRV